MVPTAEPFPRGGQPAYIPAGPPTTPAKAWSCAVEPRTGEGLDLATQALMALSWGWGRGRLQGTPNSHDFCNLHPRGHPGLAHRGVPSENRAPGWERLKVHTADSHMLVWGTRASLPSARQGSTAPTPPPAPLTLDLLVDHQGEVVQLQDVREHAQRVHQADLEEKPWSVLTGVGPGRLATGRSTRQQERWCRSTSFLCSLLQM